MCVTAIDFGDQRAKVGLYRVRIGQGLTALTQGCENLSVALLFLTGWLWFVPLSFAN